MKLIGHPEMSALPYIIVPAEELQCTEINFANAKPQANPMQSKAKTLDSDPDYTTRSLTCKD